MTSDMLGAPEQQYRHWAFGSWRIVDPAASHQGFKSQFRIRGKQDLRSVFFFACPQVFALASDRGEKFDHDRLFRRPLAWAFGLLESIINRRKKVDTSLWAALPRIL
jgi:hypothetical protein